MKISVITIVFMFLASAMIIPVGMSYASYGNSPDFTPGSSTTANQASTNMTTPSSNQTMTMPSITTPTQTSTNMTTPSSNQTMTMPATTTPQTSTNMTVSTPSTTVTTSKSTTQSMSPLKQFQSGVAAKSVQCQSGFSLVLKAEDSSPACVHSSSVQILIQRGWAAIQ
ncbi:MAG: hypothetical protein KGI28_06350 [Thaumarchaeota archaeon]|nr:hypothetical protein [Nitrososphaerota archaeon]